MLGVGEGDALRVGLGVGVGEGVGLEVVGSGVGVGSMTAGVTAGVFAADGAPRRSRHAYAPIELATSKTASGASTDGRTTKRTSFRMGGTSIVVF